MDEKRSSPGPATLFFLFYLAFFLSGRALFPSDTSELNGKQFFSGSTTTLSLSYYTMVGIQSNPITTPVPLAPAYLCSFRSTFVWARLGYAIALFGAVTWLSFSVPPLQSLIAPASAGTCDTRGLTTHRGSPLSGGTERGCSSVTRNFSRGRRSLLHK